MEAVGNHTNITVPYSPFIITDGSIITLCIIYAVIFIVGPGSNAFVIAIVGVKRKQHNASDLFVVYLAVLDMLASICVPLSTIPDLVTRYEKWYFGSAGCVILSLVAPVTTFASSWVLVAITIDRYRMITRPFNARLGSTAGLVVVLFITLASCAVCIPYALVLHMIDGEVCWQVWPHPRQGFYYFLFLESSKLLFPMIILIVMYSLCAFELSRSRQSCLLRKSMGRIAYVQRQKRNKQIVVMFVIVVVVFLVSNVPASTFTIAQTYIASHQAYEYDQHTLGVVNFVVFALASASTVINPLIYSRMHRQVRASVISLLHTFCRCARHQSLRQSTERRSHIQRSQISMRQRTKMSFIGKSLYGTNHEDSPV